MAESEETGQERTEQATPKRLDDAKRKGQVPRSKELNAMAIVMLGAAGIILLGQGMARELMGIMQHGFLPSRQEIFDLNTVISFFSSAMVTALEMLLPFLLLMLAVALLAPTSIGGWSFSVESLKPKFEKLNPIKGLKKVFSANGLVELIKAFAKFTLVTGVAMIVISFEFEQFMQLGTMTANTAIFEAGALFVWSFLIISTALILITAMDVPFQLWDHRRQMRMTRQEVKDEMKETEGNPEMRARVRQMQREMSERRMMEMVPDADVVITNPQHFAVALKYEHKKMDAPKVLARGAGLIAANIRTIAIAHNITLVESPPLARALYYNTEIGDVVPQNLFVAVAQVLAYVYQLKTVQKNGGEKPSLPQPELPEMYRKYNKSDDSEPTIH